MYTNNAACSLENDFYNVNFANVKIRMSSFRTWKPSKGYSFSPFGNSNSIESRLWN